MAHESEQLTAKVAQLRETYHKLSQSDTPSQSKLAALTDQIIATTKAISDSICADANACPQCKGPVVGLLKTPARVHQGCEMSAVYEVGCAGECALRSRGPTPDKTVEAWNARDYFKTPE